MMLISLAVWMPLTQLLSHAPKSLQHPHAHHTHLAGIWLGSCSCAACNDVHSPASPNQQPGLHTSQPWLEQYHLRFEAACRLDATTSHQDGCSKPDRHPIHGDHLPSLPLCRLWQGQTESNLMTTTCKQLFGPLVSPNACLMH